MRLLTSPNEFYCMALVKNPIVIFNFELDSNQLNEKNPKRTDDDILE